MLFFSAYRSFFYPGGGGWCNVGKGKGKVFSVNIPLLPGWGDGEYLTLFERILKPIALEFKPDLLLVNAGFDIHFADPLGDMAVTPKGFAALTRSIMDLADACCCGKVLLSLKDFPLPSHPHGVSPAAAFEPMPLAEHLSGSTQRGTVRLKAVSKRLHYEIVRYIVQKKI